MKTTLSKLILIPVFLLLISCESIDGSIYTADHPVVTIDRSQVNALNCVYLYNTEKRETGWNNSSATANAIRVLKDQALVAEGNAIVIRDIYSQDEYREGYQIDSAGIYVDVYKCPFNKAKDEN
tara:strand:+ start:1439 stop:1810 length:372 start_codon:yes stop_codon:yes gene_type:complete